MPVVYVADQGAALSKKGDRLYVYKGPNLIRWFHTLDIQQLIIVGNVALTASVFTHLLKYRIDTVFLSYYGKYKGRLVGEFGKNVNLRVNQFSFLSKEENLDDLARQYIIGKVINMQAHLQKRKKRCKSEKINQALIKNSAILEKLTDEYIPRSSLRGLEGIASKNYFATFGDLIKGTGFSFNGRNRRPPKDEINALLSLGYTFLMNQIMTATYICGLDPYYGALHEAAYGRQSLVLDLMEEFRPLVDNLVLRLINRREIRAEHFKYNLLPDEESEDDDIDQETKRLPVCMSHDGMKILITAFAKMVNSKFQLTEPQGLWTLKDIFLLQARKLSHQFEQQKPYTSFQWL